MATRIIKFEIEKALVKVWIGYNQINFVNPIHRALHQSNILHDFTIAGGVVSVWLLICSHFHHNSSQKHDMDRRTKCASHLEQPRLLSIELYCRFSSRSTIQPNICRLTLLLNSIRCARVQLGRPFLSSHTSLWLQHSNQSR